MNSPLLTISDFENEDYPIKQRLLNTGHEIVYEVHNQSKPYKSYSQSVYSTYRYYDKTEFVPKLYFLKVKNTDSGNAQKLLKANNFKIKEIDYTSHDHYVVYKFCNHMDLARRKTHDIVIVEFSKLEETKQSLIDEGVEIVNVKRISDESISYEIECLRPYVEKPITVNFNDFVI